MATSIFLSAETFADTAVTSAMGHTTAQLETPHISKNSRPNIIVILADDLGMGDIHVYNPESSLVTPNLDQLAREGVRFTDAHSNSAVCTPTRYGLLTGEYAWRTRLKRSVLFGYSRHLISPKTTTLASMLKQSGYNTAAIGKWHLGMDWAIQPGKTLDDSYDGDGVHGGGIIDYQKKIKHGPIDAGFDYYYGLSASLDFPPYSYIENDRVTTTPSLNHSGIGREGPIAEEFDFYKTGQQLLEKAQEYIREQADEDSPFFLYYALMSPHKPFVPTEEFAGSSDLGPYGDYVQETDSYLGGIVSVLKEQGIAENTLLVFTSDNGSAMQTREGLLSTIDHSWFELLPHYHRNHHDPNLGYRGYKSDIWEGGHRIPMIIHWPKTISPQISETPVVVTDLLRTLATVTQASLEDNAGRDSVDFSPALLGKTPAPRPPMVLHSFDGMFAIRHQQWKLVLGNGSGGWTSPSGKPWQGPYQLYNLDKDPAERNNLIDSEPEIANSLLTSARDILGQEFKEQQK